MNSTNEWASDNIFIIHPVLLMWIKYLNEQLYNRTETNQTVWSKRKGKNKIFSHFIIYGLIWTNASKQLYKLPKVWKKFYLSLYFIFYNNLKTTFSFNIKYAQNFKIYKALPHRSLYIGR